MAGRALFLARYYISNVLFVKIGGVICRLGLRKHKKAWSALHAKFAGHKAWLVVGNGPSLNIQDLELLSDIPSIASNKINLLFENTKWRPSLYSIVDSLVLFKLPQAHYESLPPLLTTSRGYFLSKSSRKTPWRFVFAKEYENWKQKLSGVPDPIKSGFLDGYTVTTSNIQIAMWLGAKRIYVIGCDHFYKEEGAEDVKKLAHTEGAKNHFHPDYRKPGEIVNNAPVARMEEGYARMQALGEELGIEIINISRQSALTVFKKGSVEDIVAAHEVVLSGSPLPRGG